MIKKIFFSVLVLLGISMTTFSQENLASTPPMGFMTWNYYGWDITETDVKNIVDAMVETGLRDLGYNYIVIDDGWQGGRDNKNNMIPDPVKFPSGMKSLCDYVHSKGMKIGIYSDAAQLTCGGFTASYGFEEQDANIFAEWGFDYLKYDYCNAPADSQTAIERYSRMANAIKKTGRPMVFAICEWGDREPWLWSKKVGGQLWRTTGDIRDKWYSGNPHAKPSELHSIGAGILDVLNINAELYKYAESGGWNDTDMILAGLYGSGNSSTSWYEGKGCTDTEYQTQMSLWCMMSSPLMISNDLLSMNHATKRILMNKEVIALNQDPLGKQAKRIINNENWQVFIKPLFNGDYAIGILNLTDTKSTFNLDLTEVEVFGKTWMIDLWSKKKQKVKREIVVTVDSHETKLFRFSK